MDTEFWVVWNPRAGGPTVTHDTRRSAENEALRLGALNKGQQFFVLQAVSLAQVPVDQFLRRLDDHSDLPF